MKEGLIVVNKPQGMTSHDVVDCVRRKLKTRKVGHSGTLDPMATGVLVILVGRYTKLFNRFLHFDKEYLATLVLGESTVSGDQQGKVIAQKDYSHVGRCEAEKIFSSYIGRISQIPPMVSAVKVEGKRLYSLARRGIEVDRKPRTVEIKDLKLLEFRPPLIKFYLKCSKGTYVRQLAVDIAEDLDCVGHISQIQRQSVGPFNINEAIPIPQINEDYLRTYQF